jgi:hypothetical protein
MKDRRTRRLERMAGRVGQSWRSAETEAQIEEYWNWGCQVLNLPGSDVSTYLTGLKARADRAHTRLKAIGVPVP